MPGTALGAGAEQKRHKFLLSQSLYSNMEERQ